MNLSKEDIMKKQPFSSKIGRINKVVSLKGPSSVSGKTFRIFTSENSYKLRCCKNKAEAKSIKDRVSKLPKYFPRFIGQENNFILFAWIDGVTLENHTVQNCYFIGKMIGEAHQLGLIVENENADSFIFPRIDILKKAFSDELVEKIIKKFNKLKEKLKIDIVLGFNDTQKSNFVKDKNGKIYYVDEEGFNYKIKGLGFAQLFLTIKWMKTQEEKNAFWKGYNEHHSSDYFNKDYEKFIYFVQLIRKITKKVSISDDYSSEKQEIFKML